MATYKIIIYLLLNKRTRKAQQFEKIKVICYFLGW